MEVVKPEIAEYAAELLKLMEEQLTEDETELLKKYRRI